MDSSNGCISAVQPDEFHRAVRGRAVNCRDPLRRAGSRTRNQSGAGSSAAVTGHDEQSSVLRRPGRSLGTKVLVNSASTLSTSGFVQLVRPGATGPKHTAPVRYPLMDCKIGGEESAGNSAHPRVDGSERSGRTCAASEAAKVGLGIIDHTSQRRGHQKNSAGWRIGRPESRRSSGLDLIVTTLPSSAVATAGGGHRMTLPDDRRGSSLCALRPASPGEPTSGWRSPARNGVELTESHALVPIVRY